MRDFCDKTMDHTMADDDDDPYIYFANILGKSGMIFFMIYVLEKL